MSLVMVMVVVVLVGVMLGRGWVVEVTGVVLVDIPAGVLAVHAVVFGLVDA